MNVNIKVVPARRASWVPCPHRSQSPVNMKFLVRWSLSSAAQNATAHWPRKEKPAFQTNSNLRNSLKSLNFPVFLWIYKKGFAIFSATVTRTVCDCSNNKRWHDAIACLSWSMCPNSLNTMQPRSVPYDVFRNLHLNTLILSSQRSVLSSVS